ncbi:MAG: DNA mismatch repair endonuclease MutL [Oscillospiraceae bacterium]|jgi:DNA mismatch repair protein MutL|nr:DNA mismatch repair endonuclease MutL [Oscillospiraceae bacterium]
MAAGQSSAPSEIESIEGMMAQSRIRPLDTSVVGLIAAGEVVERPALAIKELVENSIDALACSISVDIRDGGLTSFRVTDNGDGIPREELALAFMRNATSKLRDASDLDAIQTLGFRGEALASIAAVAKVTLTSRPKGSETGAAIDVEGGVILGVRDAASPEGTSIVVKELFYNTPARRKFMKKPAVEAAQVSEWMVRLMMARPDISMRLSVGGKQSFRSAGDSNLAGVIAVAWGRDTAARLIPIRGNAGGCYWEGFVGVGESAHSNRSKQLLFLNGRAVRSQAVSQVVEWACRERIIIGRSPTFVLHATIDFNLVDVNVHPNKLEVRFRDEPAVLTGVADLIRDTILARSADAYTAKHSININNISINHDDSKATDVNTLADARDASAIPVIPYSAPETDQPDDPLSLIRLAHDSALPPTFSSVQGTPQETSQATPQETQPEQQMFEYKESELRYRIIGAAFDQYIMIEYDDTLYIIDQHAAHERILFDQFERAADKPMSQPLLAPVTLTLSHAEAALTQTYATALAESGFEFEPFGDRTIRVTSVPIVLGCPAPELARAMIAALEGYGELPTARRRREELIMLSCKKAIKGGEPLTREQIERLLRACASSVAPTCPHGRPICVAIPKRELDRRFRRI